MLDSQTLKDTEVEDTKRTLKSQRDIYRASSRRDRQSGPTSPTGLPMHHRLAPRHLGDPEDAEMVRIDSVLDNLAQQVH